MINDRLYLIRLKQIKKENFFYYKEEKELLEDIVESKYNISINPWEDQNWRVILINSLKT